MDVNPVFQRYLSAPKVIKSEYIAVRIVRRLTQDYPRRIITMLFHICNGLYLYRFEMVTRCFINPYSKVI